MSAFVLRPYQEEMYTEARELMLQRVRRILVQSPTGSGKTALTAHMFKSAAEKGMDSWFVVHRRELIDQSSRAFNNSGIRHGFIASGYMQDLQQKVQICSIQSLIQRFDKLRKFGLRFPRMIAWDECHHMAASMWADMQLKTPDAFHIGLTATPWRLNGEGLNPFFDRMICGPQTADLIQMGFLSPFFLFKPKNSQIDVTGLKTKMGDWIKNDVSRAADKPTITGNAINEYLKVARGKKGIIFAASVDHSLHVVSQFNAAGIRAKHVDAKTAPMERKQATQDFIEGKIDLLSNVNLFGEGYDVPAVEVVIDLAPSQSLSAVLQRWGRALRPVYAKGFPLNTDGERREAIKRGPKPTAIILDHAGNSLGRHGLPDDYRPWDLKGGMLLKQLGAGGTYNRLCMKCNAAVPFGKDYCEYCGTKFEIQPREVLQVDGELEQFDVQALRQRQLEQEMQMSLEDLIKEGRRRGYHRPEVYAENTFKRAEQERLRRTANV